MDWNEIKKKYDDRVVVIDGIDHQIKVEIEDNPEKVHISIHIKAFGFSRLTLIADYIPKEDRIKIYDISLAKENRNKGYGSVAMKVLSEIGKRVDVAFYTGFLAEDDINDPEDPEHRDRLVHFYHKWGYTVDFQKRRIIKVLKEKQSF